MLKPFYREGILEAGCDEAGRGCLAGPVFAAAVILPPNFSDEHKQSLSLLDDSKKLSHARRNKLRPLIEKLALEYAVVAVPPAEIDELNILNASILAMHRSLDKLNKKPQMILVDGNRFKTYGNMEYKCFVGGDGLYLSIAAASVLAKTYRDEYMEEADRLYPVYDWKNNKGYPTRKHRQAIEHAGISPLHRKSFRLLDNQLEISF